MRAIKVTGPWATVAFILFIVLSVGVVYAMFTYDNFDGVTAAISMAYVTVFSMWFSFFESLIKAYRKNN